MIKQTINFDLLPNNVQALTTSELKKLLKVMKIYNERWLHFNLSDIIIGNNRNIVVKNNHNGANFNLNINDIELLLAIAKDEDLKVLFFAKGNDGVYVAVKGNDYIKIK